MGTTMTAAVLHKPEDLRMEQIGIPEIRPDEVLIQVKCCGICGTDPHIYKGRFPAPTPLVLGHEFAGEVAKVGSAVTNVKLGDKATADINIACGKCYYCRMGQKLFCKDIVQLGVHINGAFAEYIKAPEQNVYKLPTALTWEEGAYVEPLACAIRGQERANITLGSTVAIIGAGPMGLSHALLAKINGAGRVIISELNQARLRKARELGIDHVIDASKNDALKDVREITEGRGADIVFEVVGTVLTYKQALEMVRKGGTLVAFGAAPANATMDIKPFDIYSKELTIVGSYAGTYDKWVRAVELISNKRFQPSSIISKRIPLGKTLDGIIEAEDNKDVVKIMVEVNQ